jgi:hypothetical protein
MRWGFIRFSRFFRTSRGASLMGSLLNLALSKREEAPAPLAATAPLCPACAADQPGQCDRRSPPSWESCWAKAHPELLS